MVEGCRRVPKGAEGHGIALERIQPLGEANGGCLATLAGWLRGSRWSFVKPLERSFAVFGFLTVFGPRSKRHTLPGREASPLRGRHSVVTGQ